MPVLAILAKPDDPFDVCEPLHAHKCCETRGGQTLRARTLLQGQTLILADSVMLASTCYQERVGDMDEKLTCMIPASEADHATRQDLLCIASQVRPAELNCTGP